MSDPNLFARPNLEILLSIVRSRMHAIEHTPPDPDQLRSLEEQIVRQLAVDAWVLDFRVAIARDIQLGKTSEQIREEIIQKVGMMAAARTVEMQARYDAAVERERAFKSEDKSSICVTVSGPRNSPTLPIARAILELLQGTDVTCSMPEEAENPFDGDSIEQLGELRRSTRVIVQTVSVA